MEYEQKTLNSFNPYETLKLEQQNSKSELDFKILDFKTYVNKSSQTKIYPSDELGLFYSDEFYMKDCDFISQEYSIEIYPKTKSNAFSFSFKNSPNLTHLKALLTFKNDFVYYEGVKEDILQDLYKAMVRNQFLILRLNRKLDSIIEAFLESYKEDQKLVSNTLEFSICNALDPIVPKQDKILFHHPTNPDKSVYTRPLERDQLLFEYVFGKQGQAGRNLKGELINTKHIKLENPFKIKDDSIYEEQTEESIRYYSAKYGFLSQDNEGRYCMADILRVHNAFIDIHQGYLEADTVYIKKLEKGTVVAKNVYIESCTQSTIEAENIFIEKLFIANKLYPKKTLVIEKDLRNTNTIVVSPVSMFPDVSFNQEYKHIKSLSVEVNATLRKILAKMKNIYDYLVKNQIRIIKLKQHIESNDSNVYTKLIDLYDNTIKKYEADVKVYEDLTRLKFQVDSKLDAFEQATFGAKIYIHAKTIGEENVLKLKIANHSAKYVFSSDDGEKLFYFYNQDDKAYIESTEAYNQKEIDEIKLRFNEARIDKDDYQI